MAQKIGDWISNLHCGSLIAQSNNKKMNHRSWTPDDLGRCGRTEERHKSEWVMSLRQKHFISEPEPLTHVPKHGHSRAYMEMWAAWTYS